MGSLVRAVTRLKQCLTPRTPCTPRRMKSRNYSLKSLAHWASQTIDLCLVCGLSFVCFLAVQVENLLSSALIFVACVRLLLNSGSQIIKSIRMISKRIGSSRMPDVRGVARQRCFVSGCLVGRCLASRCLVDGINLMPGWWCLLDETWPSLCSLERLFTLLFVLLSI